MVELANGDLAWAYAPVYAQYKHDPARARALLDEAGFPLRGPNRMTLNLSYANGSSAEASAAEVIKQQLKAVGIEVTLSAYDRATAMGRVYMDRNYDLFLQAVVSGPDPKMAVAPLYDADNRVKGVFTNTGDWASPRFQELLAIEGVVLL